MNSSFLATSFLAKVVAAGALAVVMTALPAEGQEQKVAASAELSLGDLSRSLSDLSRRVSPAVVQVFVTRYAPRLGAVAAGAELFSRQQGSGSGVLVSSNGYIVTNAHVIEGAERVLVLLAASADETQGRQSILKPRGEVVAADIVGWDEETDLAVLKVPGENHASLVFSDSDDLTPGQIVCAFGSPLGLETSVTMGVVSGVGRQLKPEDPMIYIQTDASINPGNSGGPLVNTDGEVVGINTLIFTQSGGDEGIGFAAPSNIVKHVFRQIQAKGRVERSSLGTVAQTVTPALAQTFGLEPYRGVLIADVRPGGPADKGGLKIGDLVLTVGSPTIGTKNLENGRQFDVNIYQAPPGEMVTLDVLRNQTRQQVRVQAEERKDNTNRFQGMVTLEKNLVPRLGILALDINRDVKRLLPPLRRDRGVLVASRAAGVAPLQSQLQPGDVIYSLNRRDVTGVESLRSLLGSLTPHDPVVLQVEREGALRFLTVGSE